VVFVHVTDSVVVASINVARRLVLPKSSVAALMVQLAVTLIWTVKLAVAVAARATVLPDKAKAIEAEMMVNRLPRARMRCVKRIRLSSLVFTQFMSVFRTLCGSQKIAARTCINVIIHQFH
jgi:hypothetical protein